MEAGTATCWRQQARRHSRHLQRGLRSVHRAKRTGSLLPGQQDEYRPPTVQKRGHRRTTRTRSAPRDFTQGKAQQPHAGRRARSLTRFTTITRTGEPARGGGPDRALPSWGQGQEAVAMQWQCPWRRPRTDCAFVHESGSDGAFAHRGAGRCPCMPLAQGLYDAELPGRRPVQDRDPQDPGHLQAVPAPACAASQPVPASSLGYPPSAPPYQMIMEQPQHSVRAGSPPAGAGVSTRAVCLPPPPASASARTILSLLTASPRAMRKNGFEFA